MRARFVVSVMLAAGFVLAARGIGNLYPVSTFPMYSASDARPAASRVMVLSEGRYFEVTAFDAWACESLPALAGTSCEGTSGIPYIERDQEAFIRSHGGNGLVRVELVRRVFSFDETKRADHCVISACTVTRR